METNSGIPNSKPELRRELRDFAEAMEIILRENDYKGGWGCEDCPLEYLEARLVEEVGEYFRTVASARIPRFGGSKELLDIANFCMMIFSRIVIKPPAPTVERDWR